MTNQWKMVPVEPTDEMVEAGFEVADITMEHDSELGSTAFLNNLDEIFKTMLAAAPVPPAGDVEVLEVYGYQCRQSEQEKFFLHEYPHYWQHIPLVRQSDAMERITRLTAERDGLLEEVKQWRASNKANALAAGELVAGLQSELTKARELIESMVSHPQTVMNNRLRTKALGILAGSDETCGQDAEAAKLEPAVDCGDCPIITNGCRGTCMKADRNTEWEDTFGPDYTGEDAEAAKGGSDE